MAYSASKTLSKAALPAVLVIIINITLSIAKAQGIELDDTTIWTICGTGYAGIIALINALKNHKR